MYLMQLSRPSRVKIDNGQNVAFITIPIAWKLDT